jgi:hypothetical protein
MISSFLGSYKSIVKHNGYILEDIWLFNNQLRT